MLCTLGCPCPAGAEILHGPCNTPLCAVLHGDCLCHAVLRLCSAAVRCAVLCCAVLRGPDAWPALAARPGRCRLHARWPASRPWERTWAEASGRAPLPQASLPANCLTCFRRPRRSRLLADLFPHPTHPPSLRPSLRFISVVARFLHLQWTVLQGRELTPTISQRGAAGRQGGGAGPLEGPQAGRGRAGRHVEAGWRGAKSWHRH